MKDFFLGTLQDERFKVKKSIRIVIVKPQKHCAVYAPELNEFGWGTTSSKAIRDLQRVIVDLYSILEQDQHRLGPSLQKTWAVLQRKILRVAT